MAMIFDKPCVMRGALGVPSHGREGRRPSLLSTPCKTRNALTDSGVDQIEALLDMSKAIFSLRPSALITFGTVENSGRTSSGGVL